MNTHQRRAAQLGMPLGTAASRLRKMVLLSLLQKLGEDVCFKCGIRIETVESLSIEHKQPWENRDPALFWDLDNIAFSHLHCNRPHTHTGGSSRRKVGPEGQSWCVGHKDFSPVDDFNKNRSHWNGLHKYCKACWSKRDR